MVNIKSIDNILHKRCKHCDEWKRLEDDFYKHKGNNCGYHTYCKNCVKLKSYKWKEANREKIKESHRKYNATPKRKQVYKKFNSKLETKNKYSNWRKTNTDKLREYAKKREQHKTHKISKKEWDICKKYFNNSCAYCGLHVNDHYAIWRGVPKKMDLHKEHVVHNGSNTIDNCVPSCKNCNSSKWEYSIEEWYTKENVMTNYSKDREIKIHNWINGDFKISRV